MYKLLKVGTDCELFLKDQNNIPIPAIGLIGGTKQNPRPILGGRGFAVQEDNVMAEFNIPAAEDCQAFVKSITQVLVYLHDYTAKRGVSLDISASCAFNPQELEHPQAKQIGCEPDFCVWTSEQNQITESDLLKWMRTSGGHLHMTYLVDGRNPHPREIGRFVRMNDLVLGTASVLMDKDTRRKQLYGKPGAFRPKHYGEFEGHEYRVLSNFWIKTQKTIEWAFAGIERCVEELNKGVIEFTPELSTEIQEIINNNDVNRASSFVKRFNLQVA